MPITPKQSSMYVLLWMLFGSLQSAFCQPPLASAPTDARVSEYIRKVYQDRHGRLWLGTNDDGIAQFDGEKLRYFTTANGLAGSAVRGIVEDDHGALWFATDGGVSRYRNDMFESFTTIDGLNNNNTWSIARDLNNQIWVGTENGVCYWNGKSFVPFELPEPNIHEIEFRIAPNLVWTICVDRGGDLWFGTDGKGIFRFDGQKVTTLTKTDGLLGNQVSSIIQDRHGDMWFGYLSGGVSRQNGTSIKNFTAQDRLPDGMVWTIHQSQRGELLVSVLGSGLYRLNENGFQSCEANTRGLPKHVQALFEGRDGNLWAGCSGGLYRIDFDKVIETTTRGPWLISKTNETSTPPHMRAFEYLISKTWTVTAATGTKMHHTWKWGPGRQSIERWTDGESADGKPWHEFVVYYWHPQEQKLKVLGVSPFDSGINIGTIEFDSGSPYSAVTNSTMNQMTSRRELQTRWSFKNQNHYVETLLEKLPAGNTVELVSFQHERTDPPAVSLSQPEVSILIPDQFSFLKRILGAQWHTQSDETGKKYKWSLHWRPIANFIEGSIADESETDPQNVNMRVFIYHVPGTKVLRCLGLSATSDVFEGDVTPLSNGSFQLLLKRHDASESLKIDSTFEFLPMGNMVQTLRFPEGNDLPKSLVFNHDLISAVSK